LLLLNQNHELIFSNSSDGLVLLVSSISLCVIDSQKPVSAEKSTLLP